jgi:hypothetical protein
MLPARTMLVENEGFKKLKEVMEIEYYKYFQKQKTHTLYYEEYLRALARQRRIKSNEICKKSMVS